MNLDEAAHYWRRRLLEHKPVYRVRVRRLLELAGAERRGWAIMRRIGKTLEKFGLETQPDFRSAWIDGLVTVRLMEDQSLIRLSSDGIGVSDTAVTETTPSGIGLDPVEAESCAEFETEAEDRVLTVDENLNSPEGNAGVVETPLITLIDKGNGASIPIDPIIRVASIAAANRGVVSVLQTDTIAKAATRMMFEGYSQLAIMQGEREVRGMITWESIAKRSMLTAGSGLVSDCRVDAQVIEADGSLFDMLPTIEKFGYVLVRFREKKITGIVTASDLAVELGAMSYAFMSLGTIEGLVRKKLHPKITAEDLLLLEDHSRARKESDPAAMTFGENIRMLEREDIWSRLSVNIDKTQFNQRLLAIRDIRNDVMHFNPDPLGPTQKKELNQMEEFLRQVFV